MQQAVRCEIADGFARVLLARPERHNAFDDALIEELTQLLVAIDTDPSVAIVVLGAEGASFSAGADLGWMRRAAGRGRDENLEDARRLARLMHVLDGLSKSTVAAVQGPAYGGGVGLVACCDVAIASAAARFSLSETQLGLIPAVISPFVVRAIGARQARRYFQTAEVFDAKEAERIHLVHETVDPEALETRVAQIVAALKLTAPGARAAAKRLVAEIDGAPIDAATADLTAARIAEIRATPEAQEGLSAFLEKRVPAWRAGGSGDR